MLVIVSVASLLFTIVLFNFFEGEAAARQAGLSPLAAEPTDMPKATTSPFFSQGVPAPPLLTNEAMVLEKIRDEQRNRLESGGWVDEKAGIAHVPIAEAKKLLIQKGVPVREGAAPGSFTVRPWARGEASGGRTVTVDLPDSPVVRLPRRSTGRRTAAHQRVRSHRPSRADIRGMKVGRAGSRAHQRNAD